MAEETKKDETGEKGDQSQQVTPETVAELRQQIENLNQGIASYREDTKTHKTNYKKLQKDFEEFKSSVEVEEEEEPKSNLSPEDEKRLDAWAKQKGLISQPQLQAERQRNQIESLKAVESQAVSEFLEKHPEYDTEKEWQKILAEFQLYRQPASLDGYRRLLGRIHKDLSGGTERAREEGRVQEKLESQVKSRLSLGSGSRGAPSDDEKGLEALQKRYPNLSREQIQRRLAEIKALYPEEQKK